MAIFLESLQLEAAGGLDGLLRQLRLEHGLSPDDVLSEPYWFQDDADGKCFGPGGFSDCGDATLWLVRKRKRRTSGATRGLLRHHSNAAGGGEDQQRRPGAGEEDDGRKMLFSLFSRWTMGRSDNEEEEEAWGYALELIDGNTLSSLSPSRSSTSEESGEGTSGGPATTTSRRRKKNSVREEEGECLVSIRESKNAKDRRRESSVSSPESDLVQSLELGPCSSDEAWVWRINGDGVLFQDERALERSGRRQQQQWRAWDGRGEGEGEDENNLEGGVAVVDLVRRLIQSSLPQLESGRTKTSEGLASEEAGTNCVWRFNASEAAAGPCFVGETTTGTGETISSRPVEVKAVNAKAHVPDSSRRAMPGSQTSRRLVSFSLVRYQASASSTKLPSLSGLRPEIDPSSAGTTGPRRDEVRVFEDSRVSKGNASPDIVHNVSDTASQEGGNHTATPTQSLTRNGDASGPTMHPELKPAFQLLFTSVSPSAHASRRTKPPLKSTGSFSSHLVGASPLTIGAVVASTRNSKRANIQQVPSSLGRHSQNEHLLHRPPTPTSSDQIPGQFNDDAPHKPRKIPKHSYIEASKDGIWVDPDTGLEYPTDLRKYLGHDRKATGRHTLMGVGQYTRTVFKIKVRVESVV